MIKRIISIFAISLLFSACSNATSKNVKLDVPKPYPKKSLVELNKKFFEQEVNSALLSFYEEWKNVKYKFGGNSKKGIDCSAFTQRIFEEKFHLHIPRTTRTQVKVGKTIKKDQLEIGDLIFFKTGKIDRHVGIYMGDGRFLHASIKGVKFTKLNKPFYKKAYWTSKRILSQNPPYIASTTGI